MIYYDVRKRIPVNDKQAAEYRKTIERSGMKLGLETMKHLLKELKDPQKGLKYIHVAGTNGKGSVIAYLSQILMLAGYRIGTYTSPAVFDPMEICQVDQRPIPKADYVRLLGQVQKAQAHMEAEGLSGPTLFEAETAMAFLYFQEMQCELVLLETGLGGRLDATNCIPAPVCAVITSISMDHMAVLGDTLEAIAQEKAGIIKEGCPVVSSSQQEPVVKVLEDVCRQKCAKLITVDDRQIRSRKKEGSERRLLLYRNHPPMEIGLMGDWQLKNAAAAIEAVEVLREQGYVIREEHIRNGLEQAGWNGRFSVLSRNPLVIMDGAHNEEAAGHLARQLAEDYSSIEWIYIMGILADKQYEKVIQAMAPLAEKIFAITPTSPRALDGEKLAGMIRQHGYEAQAAASVPEAVSQALSWCSKKENRGLLAFGSFTFLKDFREAVQNELAVQGEMPRLTELLHHPLFLKQMEQIEQQEQGRQFCRHGWQHCMDVARGAALLNAERRLGLDKELIYAAALMHDLGRAEQYAKGTSHEEAGRQLALAILPACGFQPWESRCIAQAVERHRDQEETGNLLAALLAEADKKTRLCFACRAGTQCNWPENKKNQTIQL